MKILQFSNTKNGRVFALSLAIFTFFCLTNVLRWLPVVGVQMPFILLCYILLLSSLSGRTQVNKKEIVIALTIILIFFDYLFIYMEDRLRFINAPFVKIIGFNYSIFVSFFPVLYLASGNFRLIDKRKFLHFIYLICCITAVTTIIGTFIYDEPCRTLATPDETGINALYKRSNIGGYGFIYFLVLLIPILVRDILRERSVIKIGLLALFAFCIVRSAYTTALLLFFVGLGIILLLSSKNWFIRIMAIVAIVAVFINVQELLIKVGSLIGDDSYTMSTRINMLTDYSETGDVSGDMESRQYLYALSLQAFLNNPLFGKYFSDYHIGGHSEILDFLGSNGLVGLVILISLVVFLRRNTDLSKINTKDPFIKTTLILAFILALLNTFLTPELYLAILIVPLLLSGKNDNHSRTKLLRL